MSSNLAQLRLARYLNAEKFYDPDKRRFQSLAFRNSSNGGISLVDVECAIKASGDLCSHGRIFYQGNKNRPGPTGNPVIFWEIPKDVIPVNCSWEPSVSTTGDNCHGDLKDWKDKEAEKVFKKTSLEQMTICAENGSRPLQIEDLEAIHRARD
jgi:hypothetical protein